MAGLRLAVDVDLTVGAVGVIAPGREDCGKQVPVLLMRPEALIEAGAGLHRAKQLDDGRVVEVLGKRKLLHNGRAWLLGGDRRDDCLEGRCLKRRIAVLHGVRRLADAILVRIRAVVDRPTPTQVAWPVVLRVGVDVIDLVIVFGIWKAVMEKRHHAGVRKH